MNTQSLMRQSTARSKFIAKLLCEGLNPTPAAREMLANEFGYKTGFVHGSVFMLGNSRPVNTAVLDGYVQQPGTPELDFDGQTFLIRSGDHCEYCQPLKQPEALNRHVEGFGAASDLAQLHSPTTLFLTPIRECVFAVIGEICQFCTFSGRRMTAAAPKEIAKLVEEISAEMGGELQIAIGSGTPNVRDGGARYFASIVDEIRHIGQFPISVEMIPPESHASLELLRESGVSSLISSIEVWDESRRTAILPGKSKISRQRYIDCWSAALSIFGDGQVSSVLIAGLDDVESLKNGIDFMTNVGVVPTIIPFRPYDGIDLQYHPACSVEDYISISNYNANALFKKGLNPRMQSGCTKCQGCSIDDPHENLSHINV